MKMIWHIIKKDLRAIWPLWLAWLGLIAIRIPLILFYMHRGGVQALALMSLVGGCSLLADALLVFALVRGLVHEDALAGDKSFWITRPIRGSQLFVAKISGALIVCIVSPLVLLIPTWLGLDFNQSEIVRVLTYHGLLNSSLVALAFLFAAITRRGSSYWLVLLSTVVVVIVLAIASSQWLSFKLSGGDKVVAIYAGLGVVVFGVVQQFARRSIWIARGSLGASALIVAVILPHFPSHDDASVDGDRIDQPLTITWKSMDACFAKKGPKPGLPDYVRGELAIAIPKEYSRLELQLLQGKWLSPAGRVDEAMRSVPRGNLIEEQFSRMGSLLRQDGQDAFIGRASLFLSANCLWNLDQPWTYTGFSGRMRIWFIKTATVADIKPIAGAKMRTGSFVTRLIGVKSYRDAVKVTAIQAAASGSPGEEVTLLDPSGSKLVRMNGIAINSPPILWVRLAMSDCLYRTRSQEESGSRTSTQAVDRVTVVGEETHENLAELGWRFTTKVDQIIGYNDYDLKADHIAIHEADRP